MALKTIRLARQNRFYKVYGNIENNTHYLDICCRGIRRLFDVPRIQEVIFVSFYERAGVNRVKITDLAKEEVFARFDGVRMEVTYNFFMLLLELIGTRKAIYIGIEYEE